MQITFTIPDNELPRIINAIKGLYPIPTTLDVITGEQAPQFTDTQWAKEFLRRWIIQQVKRWETHMAAQQASNNVSVSDSLVEL